jgi:predicted RNA-binding Zn ribbon-like protein
MLRPRRALTDLLSLANTVHGRDGHAPLGNAAFLAPGETHDHLAGPASARRFLRDHAVALPVGRPSPANLARLRQVRRGIRALAAGDQRRYATVATDVARRVRLRLGATGIVTAHATGWNALVADLEVLLVAAVDVADRLKMCGNPDCTWVYVDQSPNRSRKWCMRTTCGNRANVRRWRERHRPR